MPAHDSCNGSLEFDPLESRARRDRRPPRSPPTQPRPRLAARRSRELGAARSFSTSEPAPTGFLAILAISRGSGSIRFVELTPTTFDDASARFLLFSPRGFWCGRRASLTSDSASQALLEVHIDARVEDAPRESSTDGRFVNSPLPSWIDGSGSGAMTEIDQAVRDHLEGGPQHPRNLREAV